MNGFPYIPREWYFENPAARERLLAAIARWQDTPWRKESSVPGPAGGVDCIGFCEALYFESGALPKFNFPRRPRDYSPHVANAKVLQYIRGELADDPQSEMLGRRMAELPIDAELMVGDLVVLKSGVELYHFVIVIDPPRCAQCRPDAGVCECDLTTPQHGNDKWELVTIFRVRAL